MEIHNAEPYPITTYKHHTHQIYYNKLTSKYFRTNYYDHWGGAMMTDMGLMTRKELAKNIIVYMTDRATFKATPLINYRT